MTINMTSEQHNYLISYCKSSKIEQSGTIESKVEGADAILCQLIPSFEGDIDEATKNRIVYNDKNYLTRTVFEMSCAKNGLYIQYHTHPGFGGAPMLSKQDIVHLRYLQGLEEDVIKINGIPVTIVEAIITDSEVAFYSYDRTRNSVNRLPLFVDGVEKVPTTEKSKWQLFLEGFKDGRAKAKIPVRR